MKQPLRVFEGSAKPYEPFWTVRNAAESESGETEIEFYGYISEYSWWEDDITPKKFKDDLNKNGAGGPVTIRINSGGGEVWAASVIRSIIMEYPGRVTTRIDGLCASAATYVATAGDRVLMQDTGYFMIHDPWLFAVGGAEDLKKAIEFLETIKAGIVDAYQTKTGLEPERLAAMMTAETWMTAKEAQELGFVDEVISGNDAKPFKMLENAAILNCLRDYTNVPPGLLASDEPPEGEQESVEPATAPAEDRELAELGDYLTIYS
jgi:ATP-dependent Clp protease protease subunit